MKTIALETSSQPGGLALLDDHQVVYEAWLPERRRTTETFAVELRDALRQVDWQPRDVELFAVCEGPGSFTGLRIGITAAKAFAYATACRLVAINTLHVIALQAAVDGEAVWTVLDAQRQQLFVARYQARDGQAVEVSPTQIVEARPWISSLPRKAVVSGTGLRAWQALIPEHVRIVPEAQWALRASSLGRLALQQESAGHTVDLWSLVPRYYRQSAAEEKRSRS